LTETTDKVDTSSGDRSSVLSQSVTPPATDYPPNTSTVSVAGAPAVDSPASESSTTDAGSIARAALAATTDEADISRATATDSATTDDLIAKYFVYSSDPAPAVQAKPNASWKERLTYGKKSRDTPGPKPIASSTQDNSTVVAAPMETKDFDALEHITQQSFLEQIRDESVDMAKAKHADENLELPVSTSKVTRSQFSRSKPSTINDK
jgi:hypothetical protein